MGSFLMTSRPHNNFEVVIPWPAGGLAHYARFDNAWHGPTVFGVGDYTGATVFESTYKAFDKSLGNLEVFASRADGVLDEYWRDNGGNFTWHGPVGLPFVAKGPPAAMFEDPRYQYNNRTYFRVFHPSATGGFSVAVRTNSPDWGMTWSSDHIDLRPTPERLVGVGATLTSIGQNQADTFDGTGRYLVAGVSYTGFLHVFQSPYGGGNKDYNPARPYESDYGPWKTAVIGRDAHPNLAGDFRGRPDIFESDYNREEAGFLPELTGWGHFGNTELAVPCRRGGIYFFWRSAGSPNHEPAPMNRGWSGPIRLSGSIYDDVSFMQYTSSQNGNGLFAMTARSRRQPGFDYFWRDRRLEWHGPQRIGAYPLDLGKAPGLAGGSTFLSPTPYIVPINEPVLAWKGAKPDQSIWWSSFDRRDWSPKQRINNVAASVGPALARYKGAMRAAWKGADWDQGIWWSSYDGKQWSDQKQIEGVSSSVGPALAVYKNRLYAAWKGTDFDEGIWWARFDGEQWSPQQHIEGVATAVGPALAVFNGKLYAAWRGAFGDQAIWWSSFDGKQWAPQRRIEGVGSSIGPSLAVFQGRLYAAWKGAMRGANDQGIWWSSFDENHWAPQKQIPDVGTSIGPALLTNGRQLIAAWKGLQGDPRMFWSTFDGNQWSPQKLLTDFTTAPE